MDSALRDLRYAARALRKSPGLVIVSVLALTIGIGLTTTMFSIVYGALMRGLPFPDGDRVVEISRDNRARDIQRAGLPVHDVLDLRERQRSFTDVAAYYQGTVNVSGGERAERFDGAFVTANTFRLLHVQPILGRDFRDGEDQPGAEPVAIIGDAMWRTRYGGDPGIVGRVIRVNGAPRTVVGVMPEGFLFPNREQIWLPLGMNPLTIKRGEGQWLSVIARPKPGVSLDQVNRELAAFSARLAAEHEETNDGFVASALPFVDAELGPQPHQLLYTMLGAVFLVLLIACANVANLLIDRAAHRTKEVAVRTALGASRWDVVRQFLAESLLLSGVGALFGVALAYGGITAFNRAIADTGVPFFIDIRLHPPVLAFTAAVAALASVVAGALPAWQSSRADIGEVLKDESRGASSLRIGRMSRGLVMFEVALSCGLLVAAGLTIKSLARLRHVDYGFATEGIFTARLGFPATYTDTTQQMRFFHTLDLRLRELPGARSAAIVSGLPGVNLGGTTFAIEGRAYAAERDYPRTRQLDVTPGYFATFDVPVLQGRALGDQDRTDAEPVVVVNQAFVREYFHGESPVGRRIRFGGARSTDPWRTIVGVVPDIFSDDAEHRRPAIVMAPLAQHHSNFVSLAVRVSGGDPMALAPAVRQTVASLDPDLPLYWVYSMHEALARPTWFYRVFGTMFMLFGFVALFLASVGLYAVMAFSVSRRSRELGIRMALGARAGDVVRLVLRQGVVQLTVGMIAGLAIAALVSRVMSVVLFDVQPRDPVIFAGVVGVLSAAGLLACVMPARRATRVDPVVALRTE
ncbi:MAG TPA: ABC transporter permease [Gemmatimonadaceae bacterium]|nr:ABC transporter permease [Gemmatimonadaceae bacterium]